MKDTTKLIWDTLYLHGEKVTISRMVVSGKIWFSSYVTIEGSEALRDDYLNNPTFRKGDEFGYDTNHRYNDKQSEAEKLSDAIHQIQSGIEQVIKVFDLEPKL